MSMYFGDVSLCYTNSLAMALDSVGVDRSEERRVGKEGRGRWAAER